jgi:hypothetical protein
MTKPANTPAIEEATGIAWSEWLVLLEKHHAKDLPHREIADMAYDELKGKLDNPGWWAQSVAVAYEQHIGRRQPGQRSDGSFESVVSKTVSGSMDKVMGIWASFVADMNTFDGVSFDGEISSTSSPSRRHWAVNLANDSRVNADVYSKGADKSALTITHAKLPDQAAAQRWRAYWQQILEKL